MNPHSTTPLAGTCFDCWQRGRAIPLIGGRCFRCSPIQPEEDPAQLTTEAVEKAAMVDVEIETVDVDI